MQDEQCQPHIVTLLTQILLLPQAEVAIVQESRDVTSVLAFATRSFPAVGKEVPPLLLFT